MAIYNNSSAFAQITLIPYSIAIKYHLTVLSSSVGKIPRTNSLLNVPFVHLPCGLLFIRSATSYNLGLKSEDFEENLQRRYVFMPYGLKWNLSGVFNTQPRSFLCCCICCLYGSSDQGLSLAYIGLYVQYF